MSADLQTRVASLIEDAFDGDVKLLASAVLPKVTGGTSLIQAEIGFKVALAKLKEIRERQLADAAEVFGAGAAD